MPVGKVQRDGVCVLSGLHRPGEFRQAIEEPFADLPAGFPISASIGMTLARTGDPGWNPDRLIREADHAMYSAKNAGGNS